MQRVLFCTDFLMAGGLERQVTELITRLDLSQFQIEVICLYADRWERSLHFAPSILEKNIPIHVLNLGYGPLAKLRGMLSLILHTWRFRPHIVHAANYHSNLLARMARLLMPPFTKLVGWVRVEYTAKQLRYEQFSYRLCAKIVCNSPHLQQQLIETAKIPAYKVIVIPNGVDTERLAQNPDPNFRQILAPNVKRVFLCVGRISQQKAQTVFIEAIGKLKASVPIRVVLLGEVENQSIQAELDTLVKQYDLHEIIAQYPQTNQPEVFYHAADVTVLVSEYEGLPNVVLESLAAGRPVIISEKANAAHLITHKITGWAVRTGDIAHLVETLNTVLNLSDSALESMQNACRERAQDFAMDAMVKQYTALYQAL